MAAGRELQKAVRGEGCLGKAHPDEPVFILRGQDALAVRTLKFWRTELVIENPKSPKLNGIDALIGEFEAWAKTNNTKIPD